MSKIGKKPIILPESVEAKISGEFLELKGNGNDIRLRIPSGIKTEIKDKNIIFIPENNLKTTKINWGTIRSLANNAVIGLAEEFSKVLEIEGIGYKANMEGDILVLNLGLSHPIKFVSPEGVKISAQKNTIKISSFDKRLVGQVAAEIRAFKKPEPYQGKGIRYQKEIVRRKAGKKVAGTGTGAAK